MAREDERIGAVTRWLFALVKKRLPPMPVGLGWTRAGTNKYKSTPGRLEVHPAPGEEWVAVEGYHAVFTGNRNGGAPHLQGRQEPKGTLLSSCRMRQTTAKLVTFFINAPLRRRRLPTKPSLPICPPYAQT